MGHDTNGSKPPMPFAPPTGQIPIIGQPYQLRGIVPQVLLRCTCDGKEPLLLIGIGATAKCPACERLFVLEKMVAVKGGEMSAEIGVGIPKPQADA